MNRALLLAFALGSYGASHSSVCAATVVISDSNFAPTDWTYEVRYDVGFASVGESVAQQLTGGNPNTFREISYSMAYSGAQLYGSVYVLNTLSGQGYDPSTQGAISSLAYSEDNTRIFADWSPAQVSGYPLLTQNGKVFLGPGFVFGPNDNDWQNKTLTNLDASSFRELFGMDLLPDSHPDFSDSGGQLSFGFARSNSYSFNANIGHGIDNFNVTLESAPEPTRTGLLALSMTWLFYRRRR